MPRPLMPAEIKPSRGCVRCGRSKDRHTPETLVCPDGRATYATLELPPNTTCSDCRHFKRTCEWLISCQPDRTSCDWYPVRFIRLEAPDAH